MYLVLHYQAAIERLKDKHQKVKVIVVCHFGMAGANIIRSKIERKLSCAEVVNVCSLRELFGEEQPEYDFIVTTERILKTDKPVFYVSLAFPERELKKMEEYIQNIQISRRLTVLLMEAPILHIGKTSNPYEVIREMCNIGKKKLFCRNMQTVWWNRKNFLLQVYFILPCLTEIRLWSGRPNW